MPPKRVVRKGIRRLADPSTASTPAEADHMREANAAAAMAAVGMDVSVMQSPADAEADAAAGVAAAAADAGDAPRSKRQGAKEEKPVSDDEESEGESEHTTPKTASKAVTKEVVEHLRTNPRFAKLPDEELEALCLKMRNTVIVADPETKEEKAIDVSTQEGLEELARARQAEVMVHDPEKNTGDMPLNMKTGMVGMPPENFPDDLNTTGMLPIPRAAVLAFMIDNMNVFTDLLALTPLIPVVIYTPKLLLLLSGERMPPTIDSFTVLRRYMGYLQILLKDDRVRQCKDAAFNWLLGRLEDKTLTKEDLTSVLERARFLEGVGEDAGPDKALLRAQITRGVMEQKLADETLEAADIDAAHHMTSVVVQDVDKLPWTDVTKVYAEDIGLAHRTMCMTLSQLVGEAVDSLKDPATGDYDEFVGRILHYTAQFVNIYELAIMRLLTEACTVGETIPRQYWADLGMRPDTFPGVEMAHNKAVSSIMESREHMSNARNRIMDMDPAYWALYDDKGADAIAPSPQDIVQFVAFLNFSADDADQTRAGMDRASQATHVHESKSVMEGVKFTGGEEEEGGAAAAAASAEAVHTTTTFVDGDTAIDDTAQFGPVFEDVAGAASTIPAVAMPPAANGSGDGDVVM